MNTFDGSKRSLTLSQALHRSNAPLSAARTFIGPPQNLPCLHHIPPAQSAQRDETAFQRLAFVPDVPPNAMSWNLLERFIESEHFNRDPSLTGELDRNESRPEILTDIAVAYLSRYANHVGIQYVLCSKLRRFPYEEIEFFLPECVCVTDCYGIRG